MGKFPSWIMATAVPEFSPGIEYWQYSVVYHPMVLNTGGGWFTDILGLNQSIGIPKISRVPLRVGAYPQAG